MSFRFMLLYLHCGTYSRQHDGLDSYLVDLTLRTPHYLILARTWRFLVCVIGLLLLRWQVELPVWPFPRLI